jgi:hypothetical protein
MLAIRAKQHFHNKGAACVTVDIGNTTNDKEPLATRFILTNRSPLSIHRVKASGQVWGPRQGGVLIVGQGDVDYIPELPPNGRFSLNPGDLTPLLRALPEKHPATIVLQLRIKYRYRDKSATEESASFRFSAVRKDDGTYVWLPMDPVIDINEVFKERSGPPKPPNKNRAYIEVHGTIMPGPLKPDQPNVSGKVALVNAGVETATNVTALYKTEVGPLQPNWKIPQPPGPKPAPKTLDSGKNLSIDFNIPLNADVVRLIDQGTYKLYVFGAIEYDDITTIRHTTKFRIVYVPGTGKFQVCSEGNSMT